MCPDSDDVDLFIIGLFALFTIFVLAYPSIESQFDSYKHGYDNGYRDFNSTLRNNACGIGYYYFPWSFNDTALYADGYNRGYLDRLNDERIKSIGA